MSNNYYNDVCTIKGTILVQKQRISQYPASKKTSVYEYIFIVVVVIVIVEV